MQSGAGSEAAVSCRGLTRWFDGRAAVDGLDLEIQAGTVFGFLGPNGAGKTTTARLILGLLSPTAGSVRVFGLDPVAQGERVRASAGVLLDQVGLYDALSAWQNLEFAARVARLPAAGRSDRIASALHRVELWDRRSDRVSAFSRGMRQKLGIARALLAEPRLLVLDEPSAALDPVNIKMLRDLLVSLAQEGGRTIFLCTHHLDEAQRICDRVGIIQAGRMLAVGSPSELGGSDGGRHGVRIRCSHPEVAAGVAARLPPGASMGALDADGLPFHLMREEDVEDVVAVLASAGAGIRAVEPVRRTLEDAYLSLVSGGEESR